VTFPKESLSYLDVLNEIARRLGLSTTTTNTTTTTTTPKQTKELANSASTLLDTILNFLQARHTLLVLDNIPLEKDEVRDVCAPFLSIAHSLPFLIAPFLLVSSRDPDAESAT
jgi:hypothetical protein